MISQTPIIDNHRMCVTAPRDVLINTAQLVVLVKDQLAHRLLTNIHRGGCGHYNSASKLCCGNHAKLSSIQLLV